MPLEICAHAFPVAVSRAFSAVAAEAMRHAPRPSNSTHTSTRCLLSPWVDVYMIAANAAPKASTIQTPRLFTYAPAAPTSSVKKLPIARNFS